MLTVHANPFGGHTLAVITDSPCCLQLLGPEDMINPHVDELSMMTYLSQFPDAKLKDGAPIKARADPSKVCIFLELPIDQAFYSLLLLHHFFQEWFGGWEGSHDTLQVVGCWGKRRGRMLRGAI